MQHDQYDEMPDELTSTALKVSQIYTNNPYTSQFYEDFVVSQLTLRELVERYCQWKDRLEHIILSKPQKMSLAACSPFLMNFRHSKIEDVEVPGQYEQASKFSIFQIQSSISLMLSLTISSFCRLKVRMQTL